MLRRSGVELYGIGRELVRIPAAAYMRAAEVAGALVLRAWLYVWPAFLKAWALAKRVLAFLEINLTPARVTLAVAGLTAVALAGSQFADYRGVTIGASAYANVEGVAGPPQVDVASAGSAHAWLGLPLAALAALIIAGCATGRWKLARMLIPVGVTVVVISLAIDRPKGLDAGDAAVAYDSVTAKLLGGFWSQLVSGVVLILLAPVLSRVLRHARGDRQPAKERKINLLSMRRLRSRRFGRTAEAGQ